MNIELYLETMDQDFSAATLQRLFAKGSGASCEASNWWIWNDWSNVWIDALSAKRDRNISQLRIRPESDGGLVLDLSTRRVYKADEDAFHVLNLLRAGATAEVAASEVGVATDEVDRVVSRLLDGGHCSVE